MDISFKRGDEKFNYRVSAIIISNGRILAMSHDKPSEYYSLPGGRVMMEETAEQAMIREVREELGASLKISRPLWLNQSFFTKDTDGLRYHEICIYFLMDTADAGLLERQNTFTRTEGTDTHIFKWLEIAQLKDETFYPLFLKKKFPTFRMGSRSERKCNDESVLSMLTLLLYKIEEFILMAFLLL